ncbi:hypothetical protein ABH927_003556 [Planotetraspora sp. GP83]
MRCDGCFGAGAGSQECAAQRGDAFGGGCQVAVVEHRAQQELEGEGRAASSNNVGAHVRALP